MSDELVCWNCGESIADIPLPISRHASCAACFEMQHNCRMCYFFHPGSIDDCDEDRADPPVIKESANFCEYFKPVPGRFERDSLRKQSSALTNLSSLFGDGDEEESEADIGAGPDGNEGARSRLDDLFDD
jgi:hypothetical protein